MQGNLKAFRIALMLVLSLFIGTVSAQTVTGNVVDETGEAVIGATVMEKGTKNATVTDFDGNFTIKLESGNVLTISYIGMQSQDVNVAGKTSVNVVLKEDATTLQDVVVVGYGTMKKSDLTGSISSADGAALAAKGTTNAMEALQGAVPGASITQTSGRAGSDFDIQIRGKSSINGDSSPLYVVDGVICSDISFLNPQDIERMDILKDASSTAIYGSRATAGVVMVTTKSGATVSKKNIERATISYDGYFGISKIARMPAYMDAEQFAQWRFLDFLGSGQVSNGVSSVPQPVFRMEANLYPQCMIFDNDGNSVIKKMLASGETYDWPSLVTQNGQKQNHYISVNGQSQSTNYHFGIGYNREEGVYVNDLQNRFNMKGSVDAKLSKYLTAGFSLNLAYTKNDYASDDAIKIAFRQVPFARPYNANGELNEKPANYEALGSNSAYQFSDAYNSLVMLRDDSKQSKTYRLLGNIYIQVKPTEWLSFKTTLSPNYVNKRTGEYTASSCGRTEEASHAEYTTKEWTWDNQLDFNKTYGDHSVNAMGLFSMNSYDYTYSQIGRSTTDDGAMMTGTEWYNLYAGTINDAKTGTAYRETKMLSYAVRLNYSYKGKYMLTATIRTDGSSKFLDGYRWGWFPSAAAAWRITEESFMKKVEWLDNLKLRVSYGVTGNNTVSGPYNSVSVKGPSIYAYGSTVANGYYPSGVINAGLIWEKSHEWNIGLDFGFLRNRINGTIDVYQKNSTDLLYSRDLPLVSGGGSLMDNVGEVRNRGIEVAINTVNIQNKDWNWTTSFNFATNSNKVIAINGEDKILKTGTSEITQSLFVGQPVNNIYAYQVAGIVSDQNMTVPDNSAARAAGFTPGSQVRSRDYYHAVYGWSEGMPILSDVDGNGVINDGDKLVLGSQDPKWTANISSSLSWKDWDFSFSIYTKQKFWVYSNTLADTYDYNYRGWNKVSMDYYVPAGTLISCDGVNADGTYINPVYQESTHYGSFPYPNAGISNYGMGLTYNKGVYNLMAIDEIWYWKVKNITLGYTFPKKLLNSWGCQSLRVYVNITNPFVFTNYKGFDPEWAGASMAKDGPSTVTYQLGASIKF